MKLVMLTLISAISACGGSDEGQTLASPETQRAAPPAPESWEREPGPMPLSVGSDFPSADSGPGVARYTPQPGSECAAEIHWWRPMPPETGGRMMVSSRRTMNVAGEDRELVTTSMFEDQETVVDAMFFQGDGWTARVVFRGGCPANEVDRFLGTITIP